MNLRRFGIISTVNMRKTSWKWNRGSVLSKNAAKAYCAPCPTKNSHNRCEFVSFTLLPYDSTPFLQRLASQHNSVPVNSYFVIVWNTRYIVVPCLMPTVKYTKRMIRLIQWNLAASWPPALVLPAVYKELLLPQSSHW
jgi:hypothetical protein